MTGINTAFAVCLFAGSALALSCSADTAEHNLDVSARARYSDLQLGDNDGKASSLRLRASIESFWSQALSSAVEVDYVASAYKNQHSDGVRFNGQPTVPDVPGSEINQLFMAYDAGLFNLKLGRQRIELDNQRFVGSFEFWQNDQTFDALFSTIDLWSASKLNYGFIWKANRILGNDAGKYLRSSDNNFEALNGLRPAGRLGNHDHDSHLMRLEINEWDFTRAVLYTYFLDSSDDPTSSSQNYGASYAIKIKPSALHYRIELEAATQERTQIDGEPQPHYLRIEAALGYRSFELGIQHERLSSDKGISFFTTLGSRHEFQGWADKFGRPPSTGLIDTALVLTWRRTPWKADIRYHTFSADKGSEKLGNEFDIDLSYNLSKRQTLHLRYADFRSSTDNFDLEDTRRAFLTYLLEFNTPI